jgi:hypothetical protein
VVKEYIIMSMVISILGIGKITKRMVKEHWVTLTAINILVGSKMA